MPGPPQLTKSSLCACQVCVPDDWTDAQIESFANRVNPTGIQSQWHIRKEGHEALAGDPERVMCNERTGCVHVMLEC